MTCAMGKIIYQDNLEHRLNILGRISCEPAASQLPRNLLPSILKLCSITQGR